MGAFLLLDASDRAITLCWERDPDVSIECVQMKTCNTASTTDGQQQQDGKDEEGGGGGSGGSQHVEAAPSSGGGGESGRGEAEANADADADADEDYWVTLSETLGSSALKKNKLRPATAYVFRRRARKQVRVCLSVGLCFVGLIFLHAVRA